MTDPIPPVDAIRIPAAAPGRKLQPVTRERGEDQGRRHSDERHEDPEQGEEGAGPHVDVLA